MTSILIKTSDSGKIETSVNTNDKGEALEAISAVIATIIRDNYEDIEMVYALVETLCDKLRFSKLDRNVIANLIIANN